jgi:hypothetical protein
MAISTAIRRKMVFAVLYILTALSFPNWFEDVDGMEPGPIAFHHLGAIQVAIVGMALFGIACFISFSPTCGTA